MENGNQVLKLLSVLYGDHPKNVLSTILKTIMLQRSAIQCGGWRPISALGCSIFSRKVNKPGTSCQADDFLDKMQD